MKFYKKDVKNVYSVGSKYNLYIRLDAISASGFDISNSVYVPVYANKTFFGRKFFENSSQLGESLLHTEVLKRGYKVWDFDKAWSFIT